MKIINAIMSVSDSRQKIKIEDNNSGHIWFEGTVDEYLCESCPGIDDKSVRTFEARGDVLILRTR